MCCLLRVYKLQCLHAGFSLSEKVEMQQVVDVKNPSNVNATQREHFDRVTHSGVVSHDCDSSLLLFAPLLLLVSFLFGHCTELSLQQS